MKKEILNENLNPISEIEKNAIAIVDENKRKSIEVIGSMQSKMYALADIKTINDIDIVFNTSNAVGIFGKLAQCYALYYAQTNLDLKNTKYKNYESYAKDKGLTRSQAFDYAKLGKYVNPINNHTIFYNSLPLDLQSKYKEYNYSQALSLACFTDNLLKLGNERVYELLDFIFSNLIISPLVSEKDLRDLKKVDGQILMVKYDKNEIHNLRDILKAQPVKEEKENKEDKNEENKEDKNEDNLIKIIKDLKELNKTTKLNTLKELISRLEKLNK